MKLSSQSCTRVDLAGGTLDCWPLHTFVADAMTLNVSIDIYTCVDLNTFTSSDIEIEVEDLNYSAKFRDLSELMQSEASELGLLKAIVGYFKPSTGFSLKTRSQSPVGGGLGGSSSLCISLIKAFAQWLGATFTVNQAVELAHNLEAKVLHKPTGTQDYVPAWVPGCYAIHYGPRGMEAQRLEISLKELADRMTLVYTGQPHHSGLNNWQVIKAAVERDASTLTSLNQLRDIAHETLEALTRRDWTQLGQCFDRELKARLQLSSGFSSPEILKLREISKPAGGAAIKICGAGGGGCVFVWSEPRDKARIQQVCAEHGFRVLSAQPIA